MQWDRNATKLLEKKNHKLWRYHVKHEEVQGGNLKHHESNQHHEYEKFKQCK